MTLDDLATLALNRLPATVRDGFAADPHDALAELGLSVAATDALDERRENGGACDGMSFIDDGVILYARTPSSRRENFTLGHELGHFLVAQHDDVLSYLADQDNAAELLESVCDRIAQRLLMPAAAVDAVLTTGPVSAATVLDLFGATHASRPVCAIALAQRLPCLGAVIIVQDDVVTFASVHPDDEQGWPEVIPRRGDAVPPGHPLKTLQSGSRLTRRSFWTNRWRREADFYIDALHDGHRIVAILAERDLWSAERLHLERTREYDTRPALEVTCCGQARQVRGYPCPDCHEGYCPVCSRCACQKAADTDQPCTGCFLAYRPHLLVNGRCENCR